MVTRAEVLLVFSRDRPCSQAKPRSVLRQLHRLLLPKTCAQQPEHQDLSTQRQDRAGHNGTALVQHPGGDDVGRERFTRTARVIFGEEFQICVHGCWFELIGNCF